mmetsp:Transcript_72693/g.199416  ORF Transcript_72693/g.199416 Transcript_72693/m.199416 type:complete len:199 (+) Transcript_72693:865-1461(+)
MWLSATIYVAAPSAVGGGGDDGAYSLGGALWLALLLAPCWLGCVLRAWQYTTVAGVVCCWYSDGRLAAAGGRRRRQWPLWRSGWLALFAAQGLERPSTVPTGARRAPWEPLPTALERSDEPPHGEADGADGGRWGGTLAAHHLHHLWPPLCPRHCRPPQRLINAATSVRPPSTMRLLFGDYVSGVLRTEGCWPGYGNT